MKPVAFGLTGLGGYAAHIGRLLQKHPDQVHLAAVCEPDLRTHAARAEELRQAGVFVTDSYDDLLRQPVEAVWLPLPIPLHKPYTERALAAGIAVMCEKPAAGAIQDLEAMVAARDRAGLPVAIGFQDIYKPSTVEIKRRLRGGQIGQIQSATLQACWPRDSQYYGRSFWAGRQKVGDVWVLDSPASNALAHFLNLALFFLGTPMGESATLARVEAELYRVNAIENYDTCAIRLTTDTGATLLTCFTHASHTMVNPVLTIHGDGGSLEYRPGGAAVFRSSIGEAEMLDLSSESQSAMVECFASAVRGDDDSRQLATLEIARAHLIAVNGASQAATIHDVPEAFVETVASGENATLRAIDGIEALFAACAEAQYLPHELGMVAWTRPSGMLDLRGYREFTGCAI